MRRARVLLCGCIGALAVLAAAPASAAEYEGAGDTGLIWDNKRDCCDDAIALAQEDSAAKCRDAGGAARIRPGSTRGMCDWEASGDTADVLYRCTATAYVNCWP